MVEWRRKEIVEGGKERERSTIPIRVPHVTRRLAKRRKNLLASMRRAEERTENACKDERSDGRRGSRREKIESMPATASHRNTTKLRV